MNKNSSSLEINISHFFQSFHLVAKFQVDSGVTALFGPSGAGKTTLINILAGLEEAQHGFVKLNGNYLYDKKTRINMSPQERQVGYVFQDIRLFPHLTIKQNLLYGCIFNKLKTKAEKLDRIVKILNLEHFLSRYPNSLSGGEKQLVAIGRTVLSEPKLILMDEPLASLDSSKKEDVIFYIESLKENYDIPIIFVSHNLDEVVRLADMMVILENGKTVATGSIHEIMSRLDAPNIVSKHERSTIIDTILIGQDEKFSLSNLSLNNIIISIPMIMLPIGSKVRLRVLASDVSLSYVKPKDNTILNSFKAKIIAFSEYHDTYVDVLLDIGTTLVARITRKSMHKMGLNTGDNIYAMFKAMALNKK